MKKPRINIFKKPNIFTAIFCFLFLIWIFLTIYEDAISMGASDIEKNIATDEIFGIAKITDGDTIKIDDKKIRLIEIDAPETKQTCFDANYEEYLCGKMSKEFLQKLADGKNVRCYYHELDRYGRYLGKCYVEEVSINKEMIKNGMAVTYFFGPKNEELILLEVSAKEKKLGIWQGAFQLPKDYRKMMKGK